MMKMQMIMGIKEVMDWCEKWGEYAGICAAHARTSSKLNLTNDDDHSVKNYHQDDDELCPSVRCTYPKV